MIGGDLDVRRNSLNLLRFFSIRMQRALASIAFLFIVHPEDDICSIFLFIILLILRVGEGCVALGSSLMLPELVTLSSCYLSF